MIPQELLKEVQASRLAIERDIAAFKYRVDIPSRAKDSIRNKPLQWLGGAAAFGFFVSVLRPRRRRTQTLAKSRAGADVIVDEKKSWTLIGVLIALIKALMPLARPALTAFAAKRFTEMASKLAS